MPEFKPVRAILVCDRDRIDPECFTEGTFEGMNVTGPVIFVVMPNGQPPVQILNIDDIPPETVESLIAKIKAFGING